MENKELLHKICLTKESVSLKNYSNMHCGGIAKFMCFPQNKQQLKNIIRFIQNNGLSYFVLGNGTNTLFNDCEYNRIVINMRYFKKIKKLIRSVYVDSGVSLVKTNYFLKTKSLAGFEWSYGIPGTVGGAIYMNAGAYGGEVCKNIVKVWCFDTISNKFIKLKKSQLQFGYRSSIFKFNRYIIIKAKFKFTKGNKKDIEKKQKEYLERRKDTQPIASYNLGSIFKKVKGKSAGQIIDELGLKGYSINGAYISKLHANFILNDGTATSNDVLELIRYIKNRVKSECNIDLEEEIKIV